MDEQNDDRRAYNRDTYLDERETMLIQADSWGDEGLMVSLTPSYLVVEFRHFRKLYSLVTGIPHEETT